MKESVAVLLVLLCLSVFAGPVVAGNIDSPAPPGSAASAMYTIEGLYNWLAQGATPTKRTGAFTEPASGPGSSTHTLNDLWDQVKTIGRVIKTGQATCYDASGALISCTDTGQDGEYQKGVTPPTGTDRFTDNGDGTVTDNLTGLVWLKNADCFGKKIWTTALSDANTLNSGECDLTDGSLEGDWRLPNVRELHSLIDYGRWMPALPNPHPFLNVQLSYYWSSTYYQSDKEYAWTVYLRLGNVSYMIKTETHYVWPVRGGY